MLDKLCDKFNSILGKKKSDKKFKRAGQGRSLNPNSNESSHNNHPDASKAAANAAERRLNPVAMPNSQQQFRAEVIKDMEEGKRRLEAEQAFDRPSQVSTILFVCDLIDSNLAKPKKEMIQEVEKYLQGQLLIEPVKASVLMICSLNTREDVEQAVPILLKYLENIANLPGEAKYRQIKMSNKTFVEKIASVKGGVEFLKAVGFCEQARQNDDGSSDTFLVLPDNVDLETLNEASKSLQDGSPISLRLYRDLKVYKIDANKALPKLDFPPEYFEPTVAELRLIQEQRTASLKKLQTLQTSKMREGEPKTQRNYRYTLIRIRFPNKFVLQGVFNVYESFEAVRVFIEENLETVNGAFTLVDPASRTPFEKETLLSYGLVPTALFHFEWDTETMAAFARSKQKPMYLNSELEHNAMTL